MIEINAILPDIFPPIALRLEPKAEKFLRHIASLAGVDVANLASSLLTERLEVEAMMIVNGLNPEETVEDAVHMDETTKLDLLADQ